MTTSGDGLTGPAPPAGRMDRRKARTRAALIAAAQAVLADGRANVPVTAITEAADLGTGSFYNHFDSKEQLFEAAVADALEKHADHIELLTAHVADPAAVFADGFRLTGLMHRRHPLLSKVILGSWRSALSSTAGLAPRARRDITAGVAAGRFTVTSVDIAMITVAGATLCLGQAIHDDPDLDDRLLTDEVTADVLRVLGMSAGEARDLATAPLPTDG